MTDTLERSGYNLSKVGLWTCSSSQILLTPFETDRPRSPAITPREEGKAVTLPFIPAHGNVYSCCDASFCNHATNAAAWPVSAAELSPAGFAAGDTKAQVSRPFAAPVASKHPRIENGLLRHSDYSAAIGIVEYRGRSPDLSAIRPQKEPHDLSSRL